MAALGRVNDVNQAGGGIIRGASTVSANGIAVGLHPSSITAHWPWKWLHSMATTTEGSPTVFAEGSPVLRVGSGNNCGHSIVSGSPDVNVP
jgi:uncharacterized Zn-binding protein involved in type VI secretion